MSVLAFSTFRSWTWLMISTFKSWTSCCVSLANLTWQARWTSSVITHGEASSPWFRWMSSVTWTVTLRAPPRGGRSLRRVNVQKRRSSLRNGRTRPLYRDCVWWEPWDQTEWPTLSSKYGLEWHLTLLDHYCIKHHHTQEFCQSCSFLSGNVGEQ